MELKGTYIADKQRYQNMEKCMHAAEEAECYCQG